MDDLVEQFYHIVFKNSETRRAYFSDGISIPEDMISNRFEYTEFEWKLSRWSQTVPPEFERIEKWMGYKFPELYKQWFSRYYRLGSYGIELIRFIPAYPQSPFWHLMSELNGGYGELLLPAGLIELGTNSLPDPVCFDTTRPRSDDDFPIVTWFHECGPNVRDGINATIFSSFQKLLECFIYYYSGDEKSWGERRPRIAKFFEIDPDGAGGKDRWYWELEMKDAEDDIDQE